MKNNSRLKKIISDREKLIKFLLWISITLDIFLIFGFVIGFSLGLGSSQIGFFLLGMVFRFGLLIFIIGIILKFIVLILSFNRDTKEKKKYYSIALSSLFRAILIGALIYGIYYIGKIMTYVG